MLGSEASGKSSILRLLAAGSSFEMQQQISMTAMCQEWLELSNMKISTIDYWAMHPGFISKIQDFVKENVDGMIMVLNAVDTDKFLTDDPNYIIQHYLAEVEETAESVLLVLVNRWDRDGATSIESIAVRIDYTLAKHGRGEQCYSIFPINAKTGTGLAESCKWFSEQLNQKA
ncbi:hypothetical protein BDZ85DRAFT_277512 [Elsinoe ampelina]|uniref:P-loop containing nucleoside triphosphate hydrolase protein n=1 Tax=Elsinoe ampelina TaxID=302913 RepID=A0A6A6GPM9_9PEZI|nr:hypothetical protein BDZ85DRAFT_277512 [Elsinoe ampelina]